MEKIISSSSAPGDLVVDPFTGSGTVPIVCKKLDRPYYAFELDEDNIEIALKRETVSIQKTFL